MADFIRPFQRALAGALTPHQGNVGTIVPNFRGNYTNAWVIGEFSGRKGYEFGAYGDFNPEKVLGEDCSRLDVTSLGVLRLEFTADLFGTNPVTLDIRGYGTRVLPRTAAGEYQLTGQTGLYAALTVGRVYLVRFRDTS